MSVVATDSEVTAAQVAGYVQAISACVAWRGRLLATVLGTSVALLFTAAVGDSAMHPALWTAGAALGFIAAWLERRLAIITAGFATALSSRDPREPGTNAGPSPWHGLIEGGGRYWGDQPPSSITFLLPLTYALLTITFVGALIFGA